MNKSKFYHIPFDRNCKSKINLRIQCATICLNHLKSKRHSILTRTHMNCFDGTASSAFSYTLRVHPAALKCNKTKGDKTSSRSGSSSTVDTLQAYSHWNVGIIWLIWLWLYTYGKCWNYLNAVISLSAEAIVKQTFFLADFYFYFGFVCRPAKGIITMYILRIVNNILHSWARAETSFLCSEIP